MGYLENQWDRRVANAGSVAFRVITEKASRLLGVTIGGMPTGGATTSWAARHVLQVPADEPDDLRPDLLDPRGPRNDEALLGGHHRGPVEPEDRAELPFRNRSRVLELSEH